MVFGPPFLVTIAKRKLASNTFASLAVPIGVCTLDVTTGRQRLIGLVERELRDHTDLRFADLRDNLQ